MGRGGAAGDRPGDLRQRRISGAFDEGRVTERLMIAARLLGLGAGTAWYGDESQQAAAKELLGIPSELTARSMVVIGHPAEERSRRTVAASRFPSWSATTGWAKPPGPDRFM